MKVSVLMERVAPPTPNEKFACRGGPHFKAPLIIGLIAPSQDFIFRRVANVGLRVFKAAFKKIPDRYPTILIPEINVT